MNIGKVWTILGTGDYRPESNPLVTFGGNYDGNTGITNVSSTVINAINALGATSVRIASFGVNVASASSNTIVLGAVPSNTTLSITGKLALKGHGQLGTPSIPSATASATGGHLGTGTYYYAVVGVDAYGGTTLDSIHTDGITVKGPSGSVSLSWPTLAGAASYRVYQGKLSGGEQQYIQAVGPTATDIGSGYVTKSPLPSSNTTYYSYTGTTGAGTYNDLQYYQFTRPSIAYDAPIEGILPNVTSPNTITIVDYNGNSSTFAAGSLKQGTTYNLKIRQITTVTPGDFLAYSEF